VIATRVGGLPDLVEDKRDGILVSPGSPQELTGALSSLARDPQLRYEMGKHAIASAPNFTMKAQFAALRGWLLESISRRHTEHIP
jgi:glycosyltransferase involved in cell wall biosynthesis